MGINKINIQNFKTFENIEVELGQYNVLIGANAAGKSNFIQVFKFLRDIAAYGLKNAIYMQGGVEFVRNTNIGASKNLICKIEYEQKEVGLNSIGAGKDDILFLKDFQAVYEFEIKFKKTRGSYEIVRDNLKVKGKLYGLSRKKMEDLKLLDRSIREISDGTIEFDVVNNKVVQKFEYPIEIDHDDFFPTYFGTKRNNRNLLLEETYPFTPYFRVLYDTSIFDFDPKLPKKAMPISGKTELAEDGENLAVVLKSLQESESKRKKFLNYLKYVMPFIENIRVRPYSDKSLLIELREVFNKNHLPASLISDGTINLTALIIALYFDTKSFIILEEPERNIHPYLISKVVKLLKEASDKKQIIVTTHNPEVIKYTDVDDILLISRDKRGFSKLAKPKDNKTLEIFLKNKIGIDELFIKQMLESRQ